jgi:cytochrome c oxidase subunit 2
MIPWLLADADGSRENLSIFDPVSPPAESIRNLSVLVLAITGFIFIVVEGILIYSIVRFRRRRAAGVAPGADATGLTESETEPPQVYGSKPIEIAWTAAPALVVFVLALVSARTLWEVNVPPLLPQDVLPPAEALFVTVVGRQWWWEYTYDNYNRKPIRSVGPDGRETDLPVVTANELHVPASEEGVPRPVYLTLKSADVCHSFWVPRLAGKTDLIPGRVNAMWFRTDQPGLYVGQCAEYCGTQHANMLLRVVVQEVRKQPREPSQAADAERYFDDWLENERKRAVEDPEVSSGRSAFLAQSCVNCHRIRGTSEKGNYGPDLTHLMSRQTLAAGMIENDPEGKNLQRWVEDPQKIKPGCLMPAFGLSKRERDDIVQYLRTLR